MTLDAPIAATPQATVATSAYVRTAPAPSLVPPLTSVGWLGRARAHLFANAVSTVLTILIVLLLVLIVPPVIDFLLVDAVWSGSNREACLPTATRPEVGACWAFIGDRFAYTIYGSYPIAERWRVDVFFGLLGFGTAWLLWLEAPRRDLGSIYFFAVLPVLTFVLLHGAPAFGTATNRLKRESRFPFWESCNKGSRPDQAVEFHRRRCINGHRVD